MPGHRFTFALLLLLATGLGCGPSLRRLQRGDVYFERCYSADRDPLVPAGERRACWQAWLDHYQQDQPPERLFYVRERLLMLRPGNAAVIAMATGDIPAVDDGESAGEGSEAETGPEITVDIEAGGLATERSLGREPEAASDRAPADLEAAPRSAASGEPIPLAITTEPDLSAVESAPERRQRRALVMPASSTTHCAEACRPRWDACVGRCTPDERAACRRACMLELRSCSRSCY